MLIPGVLGSGELFISGATPVPLLRLSVGMTNQAGYLGHD